MHKLLRFFNLMAVSNPTIALSSF